MGVPAASSSVQFAFGVCRGRLILIEVVHEGVGRKRYLIKSLYHCSKNAKTTSAKPWLVSLTKSKLTILLRRFSFPLCCEWIVLLQL